MFSFNPLCIETTFRSTCKSILSPAFNPLCIETGGKDAVFFLFFLVFQSSLHWDPLGHRKDLCVGCKLSILFALRRLDEAIEYLLNLYFQSSLHWDRLCLPSLMANSGCFQSSLHWDQMAPVRPDKGLDWTFNPLCIETKGIHQALYRLYTTFNPLCIETGWNTLHSLILGKLSILFALRQLAIRAWTPILTKLSILFALRRALK